MLLTVIECVRLFKTARCDHQTADEKKPLIKKA